MREVRTPHPRWHTCITVFLVMSQGIVGGKDLLNPAVVEVCRRSGEGVEEVTSSAGSEVRDGAEAARPKSVMSQSDNLANTSWVRSPDHDRHPRVSEGRYA